jgi:hypothetical protein
VCEAKLGQNIEASLRINKPSTANAVSTLKHDREIPFFHSV